jgi:hypothetical protein
MVVLFTFSCSGDGELSKTLSIHGSKITFLFENDMECLGHRVYSIMLKWTAGKQCVRI